MQTVLGIGLGLAFGVVFERYYLCMSSAITDVFLLRDTRKLKGLLAAVVVSAVLFNLMIAGGAIRPEPMPPWPTNILGGMVFGIGMVLAGGCFSGTLLKMGQGYIGSLVAFLGAVLGLGTLGTLMPAIIRVLSGSAGSRSGTEAPKTTLPEMLGVNPLLFALVAVGVLLVGYRVWRRPAGAPATAPLSGGESTGSIATTPNFVVGGLSLGVLLTIYLATQSEPLQVGALMAYAASGLAFLGDRHWALANPLFKHLIEDPGLAAPGALFLAGAALSALAGGRFRIRLPTRRQALSSLVGGYAMGLSTMLMIGCNVRHVLGGLPQFSVGSLFATLGIVTGARLGVTIATRIATPQA